MPRRNDLHRILIIGSGPIVIGQACEFDYSGTQAAKALRDDGYQTILVNSNPATIMTDPDLADKTYIEPLTLLYLTEIIRRERPDALLSTVGGQTALNLSVELAESGVLEKYGVELIGAKIDAIKKAEDRLLFKDAMRRIGLETPQSQLVNNVEDGLAFASRAGYPVILRASFTLGGTGGGIAYHREDLIEILERGLSLSPVHEVLIEENVLGWKEFELEVMRDLADNVIIICSIENFDPMGVHTGDSITVAPAQTLTDREYQGMRDAAIKVIREIGVETGGSNIQFAVDPHNGRMVVIEMNPRVSRSSALASKATGFPIAKIAAKLAVGYTLEEIKNDITRETPACFEPTIDYCVVKVPRFTFEKFPQADATLTTRMKSVGEAMAIGRTFKEALQKALRSLEIKRFGLLGDGANMDVDAETLRLKLAIPNAERIFYLAQAFQDGIPIDEVFELTKIDKWFLRNVQQIVSELQRLGSARVSRAVADVSSATTSATNTRYSRRRLPHFERPWAKYLVTFGTRNRRQLTPAARTVTLNAIRHFHQNRYELYAACVMPDHVHILFEPAVKADAAEGEPLFWSLSELLHSVKSFTAHEINKESRSGDDVWEKEWHDRMIRSEADLKEKFNYVTRNPWDANIVHSNEDYPWVWYPEKDFAADKTSRRDAEMNTRDECATRDKLLRAKKLGFSDRQLAFATGTTENEIRTKRKSADVIPTYRLVDTCAAEFEAYTPYYYSTYGDENEYRESGKRKIMILGGGPNRIGQGIEFDYCCVHAAFALRELGFETIMVNS